MKYLLVYIYIYIRLIIDIGVTNFSTRMSFSIVQNAELYSHAQRYLLKKSVPEVEKQHVRKLLAAVTASNTASVEQLNEILGLFQLPLLYLPINNPKRQGIQALYRGSQFAFWP